MMDDIKRTPAEVVAQLDRLSSTLHGQDQDLAIVLAAGHGKRIRSTTSKMLHEIWGQPTVARVARAAGLGLQSSNQIIVVGIKALQVAQTLGGCPGRVFAFQATQNGTGHAVSIALESVPRNAYGDVYIFAGDMGLMTPEAVAHFKDSFAASGCDMMVLTGRYEGPLEENAYGRIVRVPETDVHGKPAGPDAGKVIEIIEHKDILALSPEEEHRVDYADRTYAFSRQTLLEMTEFNSGIFAFKSAKLNAFIGQIRTDNAQGELYVTDLISIFNINGLSVGAACAQDNRTVLGFNTKSVLAEMNDIARAHAYETLKDMVSIEDRFDFFVDDEVIAALLEMNDKGPLDIAIGRGAYVGRGVTLHRGVHVGRAASITGSVEIGENCLIGEGVTISGTSDLPIEVGNNVVIKGRSTILSCLVADSLMIENCILEGKKLTDDAHGRKTIRFVFPPPVGTENVSEREDSR